MPVVRPGQTIADGSTETKLTPFQASHLRQLASWVEDLADNRRVQIVWLAPHAISGSLNSQSVLEQLKRGPRAGADVSIRVDCHGNVYPPRGPRTSVGVIDRDAWAAIWNHDCFQSFREMVNRNDHCDLCPMLTTCAVHCPADAAGWAIEDQ
ncbi:MAG: SPASM domain-containing protein [Pirellulales bacterium]